MLLGARIVGLCDTAYEPADERLLAIKLDACMLQQVRQVQPVGEPPLAIGKRPPARGKTDLMEASAHHGEHAALGPYGSELPQPVALYVEGLVINHQSLELSKAEPGCARGERSPDQRQVGGGCDRAQPAQQIPRFLCGKNRVAF